MSEAMNVARRISSWCLAVCCLLFGAPLAGEPAENPERVEWTVWPLPGIVHFKDGKPTDGVAMDALRRLMARLPGIQPEYRLGNRLRQQRNMRQGRNFCSAPLLRRADSDEYGYFIPFLVSSPIQVVIRRDDAAAFPIDSDGLSLARLAERSDLRGGFSGFRTYPPLVARWLEQAHRDGRVEQATGTPSGENLLRMVNQGRIDFTFEIATFTRAANQRLRNGGELLSVPIKGHRELVESGIYCSRNAWGKRIATQLDRAMRELASEPDALLELYRPWMPAETYQAYVADMRAYYQRRANRITTFD